MQHLKFSRAPSDVANWLYLLAKDFNGENLKVEIAGEPVLLLQSLVEADYVLRTNSVNYHKNMHWFRHMLGPSRFSEDGAAWLVRRDLTQYYLAKFDRERTYRLSEIYAIGAVRLLSEASKAGSIYLDELCLRELALSVLVENFFNVKLQNTSLDLKNMGALMSLGSDYAFSTTINKGDLLGGKLSILPKLRRLIFDDFKFFRTEEVPASDILDGLLAADADPRNSIQLEHELLTFFLAGADTTAAGVGWGCYLLAKYPNLQDRLYSALQTFWESSDNSWKSLSKVVELHAFVSEVLRLYPPIPVITRKAVNDDVVGGFEVMAGSNVSVSLVGVQHEAKNHSYPWAPNIDAYRNNSSAGSNLAFIFGPRVCGGKKFALIELATFFSVFIREAKFSLSDDSDPVFFWKSLMLRDGGQPVHVTLRA